MANNDPLELRLYDTDLTTVLGILSSASTDLYLQMNEPGSGQVKIPLNSNAAAVITSDQFVEVRYRGAVRGGFFVENIGKDEANSGEVGGQWMTISGRGAMFLLDDAIVSDDGTGASVRSFSGTKAGMIIQLIQEAQNRGGLANLDYDFTDTDDSDSTAWTDDEPLEIPVGKSLLDVVRDFSKTGIDFSILPDGSGAFVLSAYKNGIGTDKSETVYFRIGQNCQEVSHQEAGGDIRNAFKVKYKGGFTTIKDNASISARRRREGFLDLRFAGDLSAAQTFGSAELLLKKDPKKQIAIKVDDVTGPKVFATYDLGDYIMLDKTGFEESHRVRGMQLSWSDSGYAAITVDLNSIILENEIRMAQDVEWLKDVWETAHDANLLEVKYWAEIGKSNDLIDFIYDIKRDGDFLYVAGVFSKIGGVLNTNVSKYNIKTGAWSSIGPAFVYFNTYAIQPLSGIVYVGGNSSQLYSCDGSDWSDLVYCDYLSSIYCITTDGVNIYFGGNFVTGADNNSNTALGCIQQYSPATDTVSSLGTPPIGFCHALLWHAGDLYAGGTFGVYKWDGSSWSVVGTVGGTIYSLAARGNDIVAGGDQTGGVSIWDGSSWTVFGDGVNGTVRALVTYLSDVYVGGEYTDKGNYIARYSGEWDLLQNGTNNKVFALDIDENQTLFVGGIFTQAGDKTVNKIAAYYQQFAPMANYLEQRQSEFDLAGAIHAASAKTSLTAADEFGLWDSLTGLLKKITWTNIIASIKTWADTIYVSLTGNQTVDGVKTFSDFPITPSAEPAADYEVANKKYVDDHSGAGGTPGGSNTQVQFNDSGAFGGSPDMVWDDAQNILFIGDSSAYPISSGASVRLFDAVNTPGFLINALGATLAGQLRFGKADWDGVNLLNVKNNQVIGRIRGSGFDGTAWTSPRAEIRFVADDDWAVDDTPIRIEIWTTPNGSGTLTLAMTIKSDGNVNISSGKQYQVNGSNHLHSANEVSFTPAGAIAATTVQSAAEELDAEKLNIEGWIPVTETWTRTGNHTFTISGDYTATYRKGVKIRYKDGGSYEYGVVKSSSYASSTTTVNLVPNTDYAMAAATITDRYISLIDMPSGMPREFNFSPSLANLTIGNGTSLFKWRNDLKYLRGHLIFGSTSAVSGSITMTTPFDTESIIGYPRVPVGVAALLDASPLGTTLGNVVMSAANTILLQVVAHNTNSAGNNYVPIGGLSATIPFTWATNDEISFFATFP